MSEAEGLPHKNSIQCINLIVGGPCNCLGNAVNAIVVSYFANSALALFLSFLFHFFFNCLFVCFLFFLFLILTLVSA